MISRLSGSLLEKNPPQILLDVHGVGYELSVPMSTFYNLPGLGEPVTLFTHFIVREDGHFLYGFASDAERSAFRQLLKVSGIGARTALSVLSGLSVNDLTQAIASQETGLLTKIPGVGKKTAERLLLELRDKLKTSSITMPTTAHSSTNDILNALLGLGYNEREAQAVLAKLSADIGVSEGIRQALKLLSKT